MKRIVLISLLMMIASSKYSFAQSNKEIAFHQPGTGGNHKATPPGTKKHKLRGASVNRNIESSFIRSNRMLTEIKMMDVNINAVRDFTRSYKNVGDAKWFTSEGGYVANFLSKGIYTKVAYDVKGMWLYNLLEYTEADLAFEIRDRVKRKYYDDDILVVHQFEFDNNKTVYLIRMQDRQSNIVTLKVCNEEMDYITAHE
jgi:hypothetical protein